MILLGTDICSYLMKRTHPALIARVKSFAPRELKVSVVTAFELEFGARRSERYDSLIRVIEAFLDNVEILSFEPPAARQAAAIRAELESIGRTIGAYDLLIAGHARSLGATLVTNNVGELSRVADLRLENWTKPAGPT